MRIALALLLSHFLTLSTAAIATAEVIYVRAGATGSGSSWNEAWGDLQLALSAAQAGDEIWVAEGSWRPGAVGDIAATFALRSAVALYGGFAGYETTREQRDPVAHPTVLSGDLGVDDVYDPWPSGWNIGTSNASHVVTAIQMGAQAILDGFEVVAGYAVSTTGGGGMLIDSASPTVRGCRFRHNAAGFTNGGAILISNSAPIVRDCEFVQNYAHLGNGAGIAITGDSAPLIEGCRFAGNTAVGSGSRGDGGAISNESSRGVTIRRSDFTDNVARNFYPFGDYDIGWGGAIFDFADSTVIESCSFRHNQAHAGGGISTWGDQVTIANCAFEGNVATSYEMQGGGSGGDFGGGVAATSFYGETTDIVNCTLAGNRSGEGAGVASLNGHFARIRNTIIWGNSATGQEVSHLDGQIHGNADFRYSCVEALLEPIPGEDPPDPANYPGCLDTDPHLVAAATGDLHLATGSPCIDAGDNTSIPSYAGQDLDGRERRFDDPATSDTGSGTPPLVDMGAYEYGSGAPAGVGSASPPPSRALAVYPNPATGEVRLSWKSPATGPGRIEIFDCAGRLQRSLPVPVGVRERAWDGQSEASVPLPAGVYLIRMSAGGSTLTGRLLRLD